MEENQNLVSIYPNPLIVSKSYNSNNYESNLNLNNLSNNYVIFKIQCNQKNLYTIKPSVGFIPPKNIVNVPIKRFDKGENYSNNGKDKLLLRFYTINKVINNNSEAKEAFNTKIYNEESKQEIFISIKLNEQEIEQEEKKKELESTINKSEFVLENIGDDYAKGIKEYTDLNENLKKEINIINLKNQELEGIINMIKTQKELKNDKDRAMKDDRKLYKYSGNNNIKINLILIILIGLIIGANIANIYNKLFYKSPIKDIK